MSTVYIGIDHAHGPDAAVITIVDQALHQLMRWRIEHRNGREHLKLRCTGVAASWCPVHGECHCEWDGDCKLWSESCPLHARWSGHAEKVSIMGYPKDKKQEAIFLARRRSFQAAIALRDKLLELWAEEEPEPTVRADLTPGILGFRRLVVLLRMYGDRELVSELAQQAWPMAWTVSRLSTATPMKGPARRREQFEDDLLFIISQGSQPSAGEVFRLNDPDWEKKTMERRGRKGGAKFSGEYTEWRSLLLRSLGWYRDESDISYRWEPPFHPLRPLTRSLVCLPEAPWWSPTVPRHTEQEWSYIEQQEVQGRGYYGELLAPYEPVHNLPARAR